MGNSIQIIDNAVEFRTNYSASQQEEVHRVEFINWKDYTVCNVQIQGVWRTCSFPASTSVIEFLMDGMINKCIHWPQGRKYKND